MLIVSNWKAYIEAPDKARALLTRAKALARGTRTKIVLAPPAPFLGMLAATKRSNVGFAAQDISIAISGAHTGESTASTLRAAGASYAIIGHSERRAAGETLELVAQKMNRAQAQGLTPILCVGEQERDEEGKYLAFIREEIASALLALPVKERSGLVLAYEPVWAIGKSAAHAIAPLDLSEMVLYIRKVLAELLPGKSGARIPILYGGSVEPENARALAAASGIDGFLVGHASVDPATFSALVKSVS